MTSPVRCPCGRLLRDPASVVRGVGPVCAKRLSGRTEPRTPLPAPILTPAPHIPGQTALPLHLDPTPRQIRRHGVTDIPTGELL